MKARQAHPNYQDVSDRLDSMLLAQDKSCFPPLENQQKTVLAQCDNKGGTKLNTGLAKSRV
jgi:hypothetical protein